MTMDWDTRVILFHENVGLRGQFFTSAMLTLFYWHFKVNDYWLTNSLSVILLSQISKVPIRAMYRLVWVPLDYSLFFLRNYVPMHCHTFYIKPGISRTPLWRSVIFHFYQHYHLLTWNWFCNKFYAISAYSGRLFAIFRWQISHTTDVGHYSCWRTCIW